MARVRVEVPIEDKAVESVQSASKQNRRGMTVKQLAIIILIVASAIFVAKLVADNNKLEQQVKSSVTSRDPAVIVDHLKKSVELPENEVPQMRTISDSTKFTEQNPSLADIKNGDILLFFAESQKVVVYRPSNQKAVVVVTLSQPSTSETQPN